MRMHGSWFALGKGHNIEQRSRAHITISERNGAIEALQRLIILNPP
jgi:hypothetical protein